MEDFKVKYCFLHCKNPKAIIEKMYPNKFKNEDYANNQMKYLSFLDRVEKDKRWNELAMELGLTNCQIIPTEEEKIKEICGCNHCSLIENLSPQQKKVTCKGCVLSHKVREIAQWKDEQFAEKMEEIKSNIIAARDRKGYYETSRKVALDWVLRLIDEIMKGE